MSDSPIICFGQQPNGFFPKRFFAAKVQTARRMQKEMGGEIIYFYHDSDHDPRETNTLLRNRYGDTTHFNFDFENKLQRKYSPLYVKRVPPLWHVKTCRQLPAFVNAKAVEAFKTNLATNVADFCLEMYRRMGLLEGIQVARSSDPVFRAGACEVDDYFVDVPYSDEIVRARYMDGVLKLHEGGDSYLTLPATPFTRQQISPSRDTRLRWMQSVVQCTHYICGAGEQAYLRKEDAPEITFVPRDTIERSDEAYTDIPDSHQKPLLAFGAHPDDIEFGCGGVMARETRGTSGRKVHFVVCSRGEAASNGAPLVRTAEAEKAAAILGATIEFLELDGDAHLEIRVSHTIKLAEVIRRVRPDIVLAPTLVENQHPDHCRLGALVRDAVRVARFGGLTELQSLPPHTVEQLLYYAVTAEGEPRDTNPILIDISDAEIIRTWTAAMEAHSSQLVTRHYVELQLTRARLAGLRAGVEYATPLFPNDPLIFDSLAALTRSANRF